ncbi:hypothetical protein [Youngiibacter fragilis]|uniref:Uncharacterized protein n=1 Tax=Youngiibacter fragilis 232.1 TaxID=994573 RepID=V7HYU1_9CLOT|nr:hypothetical protein [Youngiibacter fragilis]ETA79135.1 hypothetical protein T472_0218610 [Youngiibacter fragilis 232.1]
MTLDDKEVKSMAEDELLELISKDQQALSEVVGILVNGKGAVRFKCDKAVRRLSEKDPILVYDHYDEIASLMASENSFLRWGSILTVSGLAAADTKRKFDRYLDLWLALLDSGQVVDSANMAGNAWKIVKARPDLEAAATRALLSIEHRTYYHKGEVSEECRLVAMGAALLSFLECFEDSSMKVEILAFAGRASHCPRKKTSSLAVKLLGRYEK